jgi:hypothetical protein
MRNGTRNTEFELLITIYFSMVIMSFIFILPKLFSSSSNLLQDLYNAFFGLAIAQFLA